MDDLKAPDPVPGGKKDFSSSASLPRAEQRRHSRFHVDVTTTQLYLKGFLTQLGIRHHNAARAAVNLSEGGVLIRTHRKFDGGSKVQVRVEIERYKDVIEAEGVVRWCFQSARDSSDYYAGIQFTTLAPRQAALISKMRAWFTSPEYKQKNSTRRRLAPPDLHK